MEKLRLTKCENSPIYLTVWYLDNEGTLFGNKKDAEVCGIDKEITATDFFDGSIEDWKQSILEQIREN